MTQTTILAIPLPRSRPPAPLKRTPTAALRCRLLIVDQGFTLCFPNAKLKLDHRELADLSADLFGDELTELRTADQISVLLTRVVRLLAQNRISPRRAAMLTYATSLLLRSAVAMDRQASVGDQCSQHHLGLAARHRRRYTSLGNEFRIELGWGWIRADYGPICGSDCDGYEHYHRIAEWGAYE